MKLIKKAIGFTKKTLKLAFRIKFKHLVFLINTISLVIIFAKTVTNRLASYRVE